MKKKPYFIHHVSALSLSMTVGVSALALVSTGLSGCRGREETVGAEVRPAAPPPPAAVVVTEITSSPGRYDNQRVMVSGEVEKVITPRIFVIGGPEFGGELLVVSDQTPPAVPGRGPGQYLSPNDIALIQGTVHNFVIADVERALGTDLENDFFITFANKPYLHASNIVINPREKQQQEQGEKAGAPGKAFTDVLAIFEVPKKTSLIGREVDLHETTIQGVASENSFWVGPNERQMLFVVVDKNALKGPDGEKIKLEKGDKISLSGELTQVPEEPTMKEVWNLSPAEASSVSLQEIYLKAEKVEISSQEQR